MHDEQDFVDAERGFVARSDERQITAADGRVVWDLDAYALLDGPPPETAKTSLWRQSQLLTKDGLFEVVPGVYQVRGYDLSVMWPHPPVEAGRRYVAAMGGAAAAVEIARRAYEEGDYRWVADELNAEARALSADALEQLGLGVGP